jgi:hypothetical protein
MYTLGPASSALVMLMLKDHVHVYAEKWHWAKGTDGHTYW